MSEKYSQEEAKRINKLGDPEATPEALRQYDWDGDFDYSRYPKGEIAKCKCSYNYYITESQIWKDKRFIRLLIDKFECRTCGGTSPEISLSIDHKDGSYTRIPYESIIYDLTTLCIGEGSCHDAITSCSRKRRYDNQRSLDVEPHVTKTIGGMDHGRSKKIEVSPHRSQSHHLS